MDTALERYALNVASATAAVSGLQLAGVYLHGSAVLGGFDTRRSDVDVLVVCDGPMTAAQQSAVAEALSEPRLPCPGRGLELSIVTLQVARHPAAEPAFELHLTTAPEDTKVIDGHQRGGDPDLVLHFAVRGRAGRLLGAGAPSTPPMSMRCSTRAARGGSRQMAHSCPRSMAASGLFDGSTAPAAS